MADIVWADVILIAPELSSVDTSLQTLFLELANDLPAAVWGEGSAQYTMARCYLAAHFATGIGSGTDAAIGEVQSENMGGLTRTYVTSIAATGGDLDSTNYGRQYKQLAKMYADRGPVICS